ncbi:DUF4372 domain-containing protein [Candidatus Pacearchaeota archaeon]|nr:DUF4372 domain-containing protein [Candidatus Pacearchaeota archaeon]
MYSGKMIFSQIMDFFPLYEFNKCINRYKGNKTIKVTDTFFYKFSQ